MKTMISMSCSLLRVAVAVPPAIRSGASGASLHWGCFFIFIVVLRWVEG